MRVLSGNLYDENITSAATMPGCVTNPEGEETVTFNLPAGMSVTSTLEGNGSTTFNFYNNGQNFHTWNSGMFMSCFLIGTGVGGMVTSFTGNPLLGSLSAFLVSNRCQHYMNRTYEDGDQYVC